MACATEICVVLSAQDFKNALASGPSPKSRTLPANRKFAGGLTSPTQALVKVRVRIDRFSIWTTSIHRIDDAWLITAKSFHIENRYEPAKN